MNLIRPGQVWENGRSLVKIQEEDDVCLLKAIVFEITEGKLHYSKCLSLTEEALRTHLKRLDCRLTDKALVAQ